MPQLPPQSVKKKVSWHAIAILLNAIDGHAPCLEVSEEATDWLPQEVLECVDDHV
jgi:hypothetical protein